MTSKRGINPIWVLLVIAMLIPIANDWFVMYRNEIHATLDSHDNRVWFNIYVGAFFFVSGACFAGMYLYLWGRHFKGSTEAIIAAAALFGLAFTEVVQANERNWWQPWQLAVGKALCILTLFALGARAVWNRWGRHDAK